VKRPARGVAHARAVLKVIEADFERESSELPTRSAVDPVHRVLLRRGAGRSSKRAHRRCAMVESLRRLGQKSISRPTDGPVFDRASAKARARTRTHVSAAPTRASRSSKSPTSVGRLKLAQGKSRSLIQSQHRVRSTPIDRASISRRPRGLPGGGPISVQVLTRASIWFESAAGSSSRYIRVLDAVV